MAYVRSDASPLPDATADSASTFKPTTMTATTTTTTTTEVDQVTAAPPISTASLVNTTSQSNSNPSSLPQSGSSHRIPTYPSTSIAQPHSAFAMMRTGILNHNHNNNEPNQPSTGTTAPVRQPRVSLSYADGPDRGRSANVTGATHDGDAIKSKGHAHGHDQDQSHRRSHSTKRKGRASMDAVRKSISLIKLSESAPVDPMQEPRRSISKRPEELQLSAKDPHSVSHPKAQKLHRAIPFAAPYQRSGVVLTNPASLSDWMVPGPLTFGYGQWWYIFFAQSFIAAIISGGINFGVAVAMYRKKNDVDLWTFSKQTVAGDMGVTVIIQQIVSFIITSSLVHHDLYAGPIGPLRRPWPPLLHLASTPQPQGSWLGVRMPQDVDADAKPLYMGKAEGKGKISGYWWWFVRTVLTGSERNDLLAAGISWRQRLERLVWTAAQGFFLCVLTFWWYWPIAIAIVAPIYGGKQLAHTWVPPIIKLLYGAIMSLLTNPIMALMAMGAESSVRRCYPELDIWEPFGGRDDFARWKMDHGVIDPAGVIKVEGAEAGEEEQEQEQETMLQSASGGSSDSSVVQAAGMDNASASVTLEKVRIVGSSSVNQTSNMLERRITEESRANMMYEKQS
ncbi:uncharacterized protein MEPE_01276 [Melanopsichium pennsylvanicum]|uniref:Uncharacterized protein n=2 Tax=Melanopsichium pennsylvanicum TaxID=63383 RepID=A0AAJ4XI65_9BASI|nr:conserved hypothetical protein [Melanopsichium pennsylvanicum 4]SNX82570.1 uncharacterized protein MEPE_01276 [Melanopsichium pennsylvanicum]